MGSVVSFFARLFGATPDPCNATNDEIQKHHEIEWQACPPKEQAGTDFPDTKKLKEDACKKQPGCGAGIQKRPRRDVELAEQRGGELETQGSLELAPFCREGLEGCIQPEVWPTEEEFQFAIERIQYNPEKIHFAVCGGSGSGKSSLVNAFRGLKNNSPHAAHTGIVETTRNITRYPDPQQGMPFNRLVWFDCPGAGTLKIPGWQYFNQQGLFIFDVIVLVYDTRFTEIDVSIIRNCERFKIPLFIVRSKADIHIQNIMKDLGNDGGAGDNYEKRQEQARQLLIDKTRQNVKENLEEAGLVMHDIFIVSSDVICSLVTKKQNKKKKTPPIIDEGRLVESVLKAAYERRYTAQAAVQSSWPIISRSNNMITYPLPLMFGQVVAHHHEPTTHMPIASSSSLINL